MANTKVFIGGRNPFDTDTTKNVRFSYAYVFEPREESKKYECSILIPKDHPQIAEIKAAIEQAKNDGIATAKLPKTFKFKSDTYTLHDGDEKGDADYEGMYYLNSKSTRKPGLVKGDPETGNLKDLTEDEFSSGCWGCVSVHFYAYNSSGNSGVACGLDNICKRPDSRESYMGGRSSAASDFGGQEEDEIF